MNNILRVYITTNIYGNNINGTILPTWNHFENGLELIKEADHQLYEYILSPPENYKDIVNHNENFLIELSSSIFKCNPQLIKQYIDELTFYNPLIFYESLWYPSLYWAMLYFCIRISKPEVAIETGCRIGWSTYFQSLAIRKNGKGKLYVLDIHDLGVPMNEEEGKDYIQGTIKSELGESKCIPGYYRNLEVVPETLLAYYEFIVGNSKITLPKLLKELGKVDYFFHDSLHKLPHMLFEYETAYKYLTNKGYILSHDIHGNSAWINFIHNHKDNLVELFPGLSMKWVQKNSLLMYEIGICRKYE